MSCLLFFISARRTFVAFRVLLYIHHIGMECVFLYCCGVVFPHRGIVAVMYAL